MTTNERLHGLLEVQRKRLLDAWFALQLTHYGGKYSIERMLSIDEYTRNTSLIRVIIVILGTPLVIFALVISQESIPLQNPSDGWKANYGFWIRVGILGAVIGYAGASQLGTWLDLPDLSLRQTVAFCCLKAAGFVAVGMAAAEMWVFPVPFFMLSLSMVWPMLLVGSLRVVVGANVFQQIRSRQDQLRRLNRLGTLQGFLCAAYPAYQVLFKVANHTVYELPVLLLLPAFKIVMKTIFASAAAYKEDMLPEQVVFTVDFFDAFYLATFMPKLSWTTLIVILVVHYVQTALELQDLHQRTQSILTRLHAATGITPNSKKKDLLATLRDLCYRSEPLRSQMRTNIRVFSSIRQRLSPEGRTLLVKLGSRQQNCSSTTNTINTTQVMPRSPVLEMISGRVSPLGGSCTIIPNSANNTTRLSREPFKRGHSHSLDGCSEILQEALEVLFTSECLVLIEYVEIVIPILYGVYVLGMAHLPSAQYHTEMFGITRENVGDMVSRMFLFGLLELISFILLAVISMRNCGIQIVYQLGFVLETQMQFVLSKLMLWIEFTLTYRVVHFGADFSFQFEWMKQPSDET